MQKFIEKGLENMLNCNELISSFDLELLPKDNFCTTENEIAAVKKIPISEKININKIIAILYLLIFRYINGNSFPAIIKKKNKIWIKKIDVKEMNFIDFFKMFENKKSEMFEYKEEEIPILFEITKNIENIPCKVNEFRFIISNTQCNIIYNNNKYLPDTIERFVENFLYLKTQIKNNSYQNIFEYDIVSKNEQILLNKFNLREKDYYHGERIIAKFYEMVRTKGDKLAAIHGKKCITYMQLNNITNYIASQLIVFNCKYIGLYMEDDLSTYIGVISILKAGKCIVAINPTYPTERIRMIMQQLNIEIILTCEYLEKKVLELKCEYIVCRIENYQRKNCKNISISTNVDNECYIIFTSGSTGIPKGVIITEKNIMIEINYLEERCNLASDSKSLHILNYSFDFGLYDILANLLGGRCLCSLDKKSMKSLKDYVDFINLLKIQNVNTTPTFFNILSSFKVKMPSLRYVHLGGEKVSYEMVSKYNDILSIDCDLYNGYGPCETTVGNALHLITQEERKGENIRLKSVPIGNPTDHSELFVLDMNEKFVPINVIGELCICGDCIGKGYVDIKKNKNKFVFIENIGNKWAYKTGDYVRWLSNGEIEFVSRIDNQVKKNGFRIELDEIDNAILKSEQISEVVSFFEQNSQRIISCVVVLEETFDKRLLNKYLRTVLPEYMLPSKIIQVQKFPLLASGKIDKINLKKYVEKIV